MPPIGDWQLQRIARGAFSRVSIAIGEQGALHIAASGRGGVVYLTNAGGAWASRALGVPAGMRSNDVDSLAIDESGRIAVAFERSDCLEPGCLEFGGEIFVAVVNPSGAWSATTRVGDGLEPSVRLHDGTVDLIYIGGRWSDDGCAEKRPVWYATNERGHWVNRRVTRDGHAGLIALERDGDPVVVAGNLCATLGPEGAFLARPVGDRRVRLDAVPGIVPYDEELVDMTIDSLGRVHLVYRRWDETDTSYYVRGDASAWTEPIPLPGRIARTITTGEDGVVHVVGFDGSHAWHASNETGIFVADLISAEPVADNVRPFHASAVVDPAGNVNVVFAMPDTDGDLWHGILTPN